MQRFTQGYFLVTASNRYLPLDGLRALAIAAVFWFHYRVVPGSAGRWGWVGVDLFFVLSGFLITGILYDSLDKTRYFSRFYMRRALRIFPLYWGLWLLFILLMLATRGRFDPYFLAWPAYVGNFLDAHALHAGLKPGHFDVLPVTIRAAGQRFYLRLGPYWSLCVEEQYYLIWPLVVWWVRDRRRLIKVCIFGMAGMLLLRIAIHLWASRAFVAENEFYYFTFTRADGLLAGAALALAARGKLGWRGVRTGWLGGAAAASVCGLALSEHAWGLFHGSTMAPWMQTYGITLVAIAATGVLVASLRSAWFARILSLPVLVNLGRVSYGFYIFHLLFFDCDRILLDALGAKWRYAVHAGIFFFVWGLSWLSFRYYESLFLRLKARWAAEMELKHAVPRTQRESERLAA